MKLLDGRNRQLNADVIAKPERCLVGRAPAIVQAAADHKLPVTLVVQNVRGRLRPELARNNAALHGEKTHRSWFVDIPDRAPATKKRL